jgi:DNA modification methylase
MTNQLFYGDNLEVLRRHIKDETVDLCYIDPPFNSKRNYNQIYNNVGKEDQAQAQAFVDTWVWDDHANQGLAEIQENYQGHFTSQSIDLISGLDKVLGKGSLLAYLVSMTLRIAEIQRVLKPTGSFYLHCDPSASHYLKIIIDAIFCAQGGDFLSEISWKRTTAHNDAKQGRKQYGNIRDIIFFYVKSNNWIWNQQYTEYSKDYIEKTYKFIEEKTGRRYCFDNLTAAKPGGDVSYEFYGTYPYKGRYWAYSKEKMEEFKQQGRLYFPKNQGAPRYIRYLDEMPGVALQNNWDDISPLTATAKERLGYPTQKPETLLERIIQASSNEGDLILDAYCGCGTTIAVAERLNRRWIGIDITYQSISLMLKRLEDSFGQNVLENITLNGIPKDLESAVALATKADDRTRKEFEKWAVLTYSNNRAVINTKKGGDKGVDGIAYFQGDNKEPEKIIFQVKSGSIKRGDIDALQGAMVLQKAEIGVFITLKEPTKGMIQTAKSAGIYQSRFMSEPIDKIQIITIQEILEEKKRLDIRLAFEVLKSAEKQRETKSTQMSLLEENFEQ